MRINRKTQRNGRRVINDRRVFVIYSDDHESVDVRHLMHVLTVVLGCEAVQSTIPSLSDQPEDLHASLCLEQDAEATVFVIGHGGFDCTGKQAFVWNSEGDRVHLNSKTFYPGHSVSAFFAFLCNGVDCQTDTRNNRKVASEFKGAASEIKSKWLLNKQEAVSEAENRTNEMWINCMSGQVCERYLHSCNPGLHALLLGLCLDPWGNLADLRWTLRNRVLANEDIFPFAVTNSRVRGASRKFPWNSNSASRSLSQNGKTLVDLARHEVEDPATVQKMLLVHGTAPCGDELSCSVCDRQSCIYTPRSPNPFDVVASQEERNVATSALLWVGAWAGNNWRGSKSGVPMAVKVLDEEESSEESESEDREFDEVDN
jgi:hypothetical protein